MAFEIEMVLAADPHPALEAAWRRPIAASASPRFKVSGGVTCCAFAGIEIPDVDDAGSSRRRSSQSGQRGGPVARLGDNRRRSAGRGTAPGLRQAPDRRGRPLGEMSLEPGMSFAGQHVDDARCRRPPTGPSSPASPWARSTSRGAMQRAGRFRHVVDIDRLPETCLWARIRGAGRLHATGDFPGLEDRVRRCLFMAMPSRRTFLETWTAPSCPSSRHRNAAAGSSLSASGMRRWRACRSAA